MVEDPLVAAAVLLFKVPEGKELFRVGKATSWFCEDTICVNQALSGVK